MPLLQLEELVLRSDMGENERKKGVKLHLNPEHYRIPKSGILPDPYIRETNGSTNPRNYRIPKFENLPDSVIWNVK